MHIRSGFILLLVGVLLAGCYSSALEATNTITNNRITYMSVPFDPDQSVNDPFRIVGVTPNGSEWWIIIEYSGGCNEHSFYTWWEPDMYNESPLSGGFTLSHDSNGDACEAIVRDTLRLEMGLVVEPDLVASGTTILVNANSSEAISINAELATIQQSKSCLLNASILRNACGTGIWSDKWLLLEDSIGISGKLWIIPVKNDANISLSIPESGEYTVGVTLLFGYKTEDLSPSCYVFDDAQAIPAQINCLTKQ